MDDLMQIIEYKKEWRTILVPFMSTLNEPPEYSSINVYGSCGKCLLHLAVQANLHDLCLFLIDNGGDVSITTEDSKETALHLSINKTVDFEISSLLVQNGANIDAVSLQKYPTALHSVINFSDHKTTPCPGLDTINMYENQCRKLELLLENGANINVLTQYDETALHVLTQGTKSEVDVTCVEFKNTMFRMLNLLIKHDADLNFQTIMNTTTPLQNACMDRQTYFISVLIENGACQYVTTEITGESLLHLVTTFCHNIKTIMDAINTLCSYGLSINSQSARGEGILHKIVQYHEQWYQIEWYQALINAGIDIHLTDIFGRTILFHLTETIERYNKKNHSRSLLRFFIENDLSINHCDIKGGTALMEAASRRMLKAVTILLEEGADLNMTDKWNRSCLHHLILSVEETHFLQELELAPKIEILNMLLKNGADISTRDTFGKTAFEYVDCIAESEDKMLVLEYMQSHDIHSPENVVMEKMFSARQKMKDYLFVEKDSEVESKDEEIDKSNKLDELIEGFWTEGLGSVEYNKSFQKIKGHVDIFVKMICEEISKLHPGLNLRPQISGSVSEGTKVGLPDEFDYLLVLEGFEDSFTVPKQCPNNIVLGYTQLKLNDNSTAGEIFKKFCNDNNYFDGMKFLTFFHEVVLKVISCPSIWVDCELYSTFYTRIKTVQAGPANYFVDVVAPDGTFGNIAVTIDLVPTVLLPEDWQPEEFVGFPFKCKYSGKLFAFDQSTRFCAALTKHNPDDSTLVRVSYSLFEAQLIRSLSSSQRNAYMILKTWISYFYFIDDFDETYQISDYISTYVLKTAIIHNSYIARGDVDSKVSQFTPEYSSVRDEEQGCQNDKEILHHLNLILQKMLSWTENYRLPSFFVRNLNLGTDFDCITIFCYKLMNILNGKKTTKVR